MNHIAGGAGAIYINTSGGSAEAVGRNIIPVVWIAVADLVAGGTGNANTGIAVAETIRAGAIQTNIVSKNPVAGRTFRVGADQPDTIPTVAGNNIPNVVLLFATNGIGAAMNIYAGQSV